jgi:HlyD family secretion protein
LKKLVICPIILGLIGTGVVYWVRSARSVLIEEDTFTYAAVEFGTINETTSATGIVRPRAVVAVSSELPGQVVKIFVDVNDVVKENDPLVQLDDEMACLRLRQAEEKVRSAQAVIEQAQALQEAAQRGLNRQLELEKSGSGFRVEADRYRSQLKAAQAAVLTAQSKKAEAQAGLNLALLGKERMIVRVPKTPSPTPPTASSARRYRVLDRTVVLGQMVGASVPTPLFTLATDLTDMQIHAQVAESDIAQVRVGLEATFTVSAYPETEEAFQGSVTQRRPMPAQVQGAVYYNVIIDTANSVDPQGRDWRLLPGMTVAVDIIRSKHCRVWKAPTTALSFELDEHYQPEAAREKLKQWQRRPDHDDWKPLWVWDRQRSALWPIFVRIGGLKSGKPGIKDGQHNEILEWEPGQEPRVGGDRIKVIIGAPPYRKPGLFDLRTNLKLS